MGAFARIEGIEAYKAERESMTRVGTALREMREKRKITLRGLAEKVGLSAPFLSDVEHGRRRLSHLEEVCQALGCSMEYFRKAAGACEHCKGTGYAL